MHPSLYKVNSTRISLIAARLKGKVEAQRQRKHVRVPGREEFLADVAREALVVMSPHLGEVGSEPAQEVIAADTPEEEDDEEEEADPDTHFKRKPRSPSLGSFPQKERKKSGRPMSRHRGTLQIREAKAPMAYVSLTTAPVAAYVPLLLSPVVEPAAGEASRKFVPVTSKISDRGKTAQKVYVLKI